MTAVDAPVAPERGLRSDLVGRMFVHPLFDYGLIGGGLSLAVALAVVLAGDTVAGIDAFTLAVVVLVTNIAHFASSTVRLYTLPGASATWPFLTRGLPLLSLGFLALCLARPEGLGSFLVKLYLTWSPYHYAAQTYGLVVMYAYRSGCRLGDTDKRWVRAGCLLPFVHNFLTADGVGLGWLLAPTALAWAPWALDAREAAGHGLAALGVAAPLALFVRLRRGRGGPLPLIGPVLMLANGVWWFLLLPLDAFVWATVFHGVQYLAIVLVFHVREQAARPDNRHGRAYHALRFYALSLALGFCLFQVLPDGFAWAGFGMVESMLLVVAAINLHHFVVDAYIWRLRPGGANRRIVEEPPTGRSPSMRRPPVPGPVDLARRRPGA